MNKIFKQSKWTPIIYYKTHTSPNGYNGSYKRKLNNLSMRNDLVKKAGLAPQLVEDYLIIQASRLNLDKTRLVGDKLKKLRL